MLNGLGYVGQLSYRCNYLLIIPLNKHDLKDNYRLSQRCYKNTVLYGLEVEDWFDSRTGCSLRMLLYALGACGVRCSQGVAMPYPPILTLDR